MREKHYTDEHIDFLRKIAKGKTRQDITNRFNKKFNQNRTVRAIGSQLSRHKIRTGMQGHATQFKKGHKTWNKGMKQEDFLSKGQINRSKKTRFKRGNVPYTRQEVGTERVNEHGFVEMKIKQPNVWKLKHRHVWEEANGEIPYRHVIMFKDRNKKNCALDNLVMVYQNTITTIGKRDSLTEYPEINEAIFNLTELEVKTNVIKAEGGK